MDAVQMDAILRSIYHDAEEWKNNVKSTDMEKCAYLGAVFMVVEKYDPRNAGGLYTAINKMFFRDQDQTE